MRKFTSAPTPVPDEQILAVTVSSWQSRTLTVATELESVDLIAQKQRHFGVLAAQTKSHSPSSTSGGLYGAWAGLEGSIRTGERGFFDQIYGDDFWAFCRRNPRAGEVLNEAMAEVRQGLEVLL